MKRSTFVRRAAGAAGLLALLSLPLDAYARAEFDPATNGLRLKNDALKTFDFETADGLVGVELASWVRSSGYQGYATTSEHGCSAPRRLPIRLTPAADAVEGSHALRLGADGKGLAIVDDVALREREGRKFEVRSGRARTASLRSSTSSTTGSGEHLRRQGAVRDRARRAKRARDHGRLGGVLDRTSRRPRSGARRVRAVLVMPP